MAQNRFIVEVEKAKEASGDTPSRGPVYRSIFAKDGFPPPVQGLDSCWDVFRLVYHFDFDLHSLYYLNFYENEYSILSIYLFHECVM